MQIRRAVRPRLRLKGITPRRMAAARRALQRERARHPLFAAQVAEEQESPQARIGRIDLERLQHEQARRDLAARHWRWGRRMLQMQEAPVRQEILDAWNRSSIPAQPCYFADFVRRALAKRGVLD